MVLNEQILVFGNAFDLSYVLNSRCSDFFKHRFHKLLGSEFSGNVRFKLNSRHGNNPCNG